MGQRDKCRLELGGRQIDAAFDHALEVVRERAGIAAGRGGVVADLLDAEEDREHRAQLIHTGCDSCVTKRSPHPLSQ